MAVGGWIAGRWVRGLGGWKAMLQCSSQYGRPGVLGLPQKWKSSCLGSPMGQRQSPDSRSRTVFGLATFLGGLEAALIFIQPHARRLLWRRTHSVLSAR